VYTQTMTQTTQKERIESRDQGTPIELLDHEKRRELKKKSRKTLKKHYSLLLILAIIAIFIGSEFSGGALFMHITDSKLPMQVSEQSAGSGDPGDGSSEHSLVPDISQASEVFSDPGVEVFRDIISGNVIEGIELSDELMEAYANSGDSVIGHTEGVIASLVGTVTSGHLYIKVLQAIFTITDSPKLSLIIFVLLAILVYALFFALIREPFTAVIRRMYLEARTYDKVPFHHMFHIKHAKRWIGASLAVTYTDLLLFLWFFTIAGAFIKRYSYYMVPYIVGENPDVTPRQAVALSRRMMDGHKMECFKLEVSLFGWLALGFLTGGFLNVFYYAPYKLSIMSEYYVRIRAYAKAMEIEGHELLDDDYLVGHADLDLLEETYREAAKERKELDQYDMELTGHKRFFAENLALWTGTMEGKEEYQRVENRKFQLEGDLDSAAALAYPDRLNPRLRELPLKDRLRTDFIRCYTFWNLFLMFFLFAFIGWVWEVIVFMVETGEFVNRGSLYGPWVPIYGAGGIMILVILCKVRTRPFVLFFATAVLCGIVEYFTSYFMEIFTGERYWDYSGYFLNLDGRICAEGLFAFAALGSLAVYFIAPLLDDLFMRVNNKIIRTVTICLLAAFTCDIVYSCIHPHTGKGITDMGMTEPERPESLSAHRISPSPGSGTSSQSYIKKMLA